LQVMLDGFDGDHGEMYAFIYAFSVNN
jgi:hypothetical protein